MSWLSEHPWAQRIVTIAAGVGVGMLGLAFPPAATFTTAAAVGLIGWATRHPADRRRRDPDDEP